MRKIRRVLPIYYFVIYLIVGLVLYLLFPISKIVYTPYTYLGIPIIGIGIALLIWAVTIFKIKKTSLIFEKPLALVTEGPFRYSRNPIYLGFVLILLGVAILLGSFIVFVAPVAMFVTMEGMFIPYEEQLLTETFREKYLDYKKAVRRWL